MDEKIDLITYMGKQHPFYRVKLRGRNQQSTQKLKTFTSYNIIETQKPTSIHGNFYINCLILLHNKIGKINLLWLKTLTSIGEKSFIKALEEI